MDSYCFTILIRAILAGYYNSIEQQQKIIHIYIPKTVITRIKLGSKPELVAKYINYTPQPITLIVLSVDCVLKVPLWSLKIRSPSIVMKYTVCPTIINTSDSYNIFIAGHTRYATLNPDANRFFGFFSSGDDCGNLVHPRIPKYSRIFVLDPVSRHWGNFLTCSYTRTYKCFSKGWK